VSNLLQVQEQNVVNLPAYIKSIQSTHNVI